MARQGAASNTAKRLRLHNFRIRQTGESLIAILHIHGHQQSIQLQQIIELIAVDQLRRFSKFQSVLAWTRLSNQLQNLIETHKIERCRSDSMEHCWFELCKVSITEIRPDKNRFCRRITWTIDCRRTSQNYERSIWRRRLCWHWYGQIQIPLGVGTSHIQQFTVIYEGRCGSIYRNKNGKIHKETPGWPLFGGFALFDVWSTTRTLFLSWNRLF